MGAYYSVLTTTRFSVLQIKRKASGNFDHEKFAKRVTGVLLVVLSVCIAGVNILSMAGIFMIRKNCMIWVLNIRVLDSNDEYISNRDSWLCGF